MKPCSAFKIRIELSIINYFLSRNMTHGHEVLQMMEGNSYTEESLIKAIINKFGADERFYTCSAEDLTAEQLVEFLKERGKFMPTSADGFTVDVSKVCKK